MKIVQLVGIAALSVLLFGCTSQTSYLQNTQSDVVDTVIPTQTPTASEPSQTEKPYSHTVELPEIKGEDYILDKLGVPILDSNTHFDQYYLELSLLRVYEYENSTFMDAICTNTYSSDLEGEARICFYGEDGKLYAEGKILTADGRLVLPAGASTPIYAEIMTEISVVGMEYSIEITTPFGPIGED
ncbi:MAG: hypothetical protein PHT58_03215 [Eubacteriales bacterium]|nr:hypothetical protein [Eubacteriales bacterium]